MYFHGDNLLRHPVCTCHAAYHLLPHKELCTFNHRCSYLLNLITDFLLFSIFLCREVLIRSSWPLKCYTNFDNPSLLLHPNSPSWYATAQVTGISTSQTLRTPFYLYPNFLLFLQPISLITLFTKVSPAVVPALLLSMERSNMADIAEYNVREHRGPNRKSRDPRESGHEA